MSQFQTLEDFKSSLSLAEPPKEMSLHLKALWYDANEDWDSAHKAIQDEGDAFSAQIHAYLHRKEGDLGNADYWYRRSGSSRPRLSLEEEWMELVRHGVQIDTGH